MNDASPGRLPCSPVQRLLSLAAIAAVPLFILAASGCVEPHPTEPAAEAAPPAPPIDPDRIAPLLPGMGDLSMKITTSVPLAQTFFNQGLVLSYGFNHAEAARSFREAARLDPRCAMCWWGAALVLGPNINMKMEADAAPAAWEALKKAQELAPGASAPEQDWIEALSHRYAEDAVEDRTSLDVAYADAMRALAEKYPDDVNARVLMAEALMDLHPWDFWDRDGRPREWTPEILEAIEAAMSMSPGHPGANHFYIHAVEASKDPDRALDAAGRLDAAVPGAGHLVHMPSHIYIRTGRYQQAIEANERAVASDNEYVTQCHAQGIYPLGYMPHNRHFLWVSATLAGNRATAFDAARGIAGSIDTQKMREEGLGTLQHYWSSPLWAWIRFDAWEEILAYPEPDEDLVYPRGVRRFARGMAMASTGRLDEAAAELAALKTLAADPALEKVTIWDINNTTDLLAIAVEVLTGEISAKQGDTATAIAHLRKGVALEDSLNYDEPPPWSNPVRENLGAVLIAAGKAGEAERVYREDLERFPENGWSLFGLEASLRAQGKSAEADEVKARFEKAWAHADTTLTSSRL
jgi:tetratricopeptide (TPR) repeat protein